MDFDTSDVAREHKAGLPAGDAQDVYDAMMRTFEEYKSENDDRLKAIEKRGGDVIAEDKVARIDAALNAHQQRLDESSLKGARPAVRTTPCAPTAPKSTNPPSTPIAAAAKALVSGRSRPRRCRWAPVRRRLSGAGGNRDRDRQAAHRSFADAIDFASRTISGGIYRKPFMITGPATGWVGETAARPQTASPVLDELSFPAMELYAMPAATATLLEDSAVNIDDWLAGEVELTFAMQEGTAFVTGDGSNKPSRTQLRGDVTMPGCAISGSHSRARQPCGHRALG
jgi:predicted phage gp36 major capsid-like protein